MKRRVQGILIGIVALICLIVTFRHSGYADTDLTGAWNCNCGATFYIRQMGNSVYWYSETNPYNPLWSNIFTGYISGNQINGSWVDVPKGSTRSFGTLTAVLDSSGRTLSITGQTGGFGYFVLTR